VKELLKNSGSGPIHILDLGCGGGDMMKLLKRQIKTVATCKGVDANPHIVKYAVEHNGDSQISFAVGNVLTDSFKKETCDVAVATLFLHHFTNDQLVDILTALKEQAKVGVVINDLHRHPLAYYSIKILTRLLSKSSMVKYDAPLSVLRGLTRNEWRFILEKAGTKQYSLKWKWAFRWQIIIRNQAIA
jgi:ubiquinone/menaquinone biosynthesis C-methylase UbiE